MMTQTANQYLRPEYGLDLRPIDANKSPLALLAKTCSSIGVDTPSIKSLTGSSSNSSSSSSTNSLSNERRTTPKSKSADSNDASSSKLNFKPYELSSKNKWHDGEKSASDKATLSSNSQSKANGSSPSVSQTSPDLQKQQANASNSSAPLSYTSLGLPDMHKDSLAAFYKTYGFLSPNCCPTTAGSPYASLMPPPITLDKTGAYPSIYPPTPSATAAAALAAYNYARVKGMSGMVPGASNPLCRDPYCGGACGQYGPMHNSHAALLAASQASLAMRDAAVHSQSPCTPATCPNGCNQCEHQRYLAAIAAYGNSFPGLAPGMQMSYHPQLSASYASSLAAAAALHHRTTSNEVHICNWKGDTYCGKQFASSEELYQHLKTHSTTSKAESRTSPPTSAPSAHRPSSHSPAVSAAQHHSGTPSPQSQTARHSSSSTGNNNVSPSPGAHSLSQLHNSRYHPYSKPPTSVATSLPPSALASAAAYANGATSSYPHPFGLPPTSLPSFAASSMYYPYMAPSLFSGRIGPPVPP